jgi:hypothetical protein
LGPFDGSTSRRHMICSQTEIKVCISSYTLSNHRPLISVKHLPQPTWSPSIQHASRLGYIKLSTRSRRARSYASLYWTEHHLNIVRGRSLVGSPSSLTDNFGPSPKVFANPTLIRTSRKERNRSNTSSTTGIQQFNAEALHSNKAELEANSNLDVVAQNWTKEEFADKRRLVLFKRSQSGVTIGISFSVVSTDCLHPNSVFISRMY